jgi:hypothetical protein
VAYYQPYFNVDTEDVAMRLTCAVKAYQGKTLFDTHHDADLYGPFWISVTLALTLFVVSNLASFMSHPASGPEWMYDFSLLASGFSVILGYFVGASAILWASVRGNCITSSLPSTSTCLITPSFVTYVVPQLRWRSLPGKLTDLVCIYGYSATIWVPMAVRLLVEGQTQIAIDIIGCVACERLCARCRAS